MGVVLGAYSFGSFSLLTTLAGVIAGLNLIVCFTFSWIFRRLYDYLIGSLVLLTSGCFIFFC